MEIPRVLDNVRILQHGYIAKYRHLTFMVTEYIEDDGKKWLHASVSRSDKRLPDYADLKHLKEICIGADKTALQVLPPKGKYFSGEKYEKEVLHLWHCLDGDVTPDFRKRSPLTGELEV